MRRFIALAVVALVAVTMALAVLGCGAKKEEPASTPSSEMTPPAETMTSDSTMMADSSMHH
ncbi:MAG TPA: hypothetical protein VGK89_07425 [Candidatus Eisenbacteria bacterium]|jgi:hypothetical protein